MSEIEPQFSVDKFSIGGCTDKNKPQTESYTHPDVVAAYTSGRPSYPPEIMQTIIKKFNDSKRTLPGDLAVDVGCGSGQFTQTISSHFKNVIGIDPSEPQISQAKINTPEDNIQYKLGTCSDLIATDQSVDLITVGTAIHRFTDIDTFLKEVDRCLKPGGIYSYFVQYMKVKEPLCEMNRIIVKYVFSKELLGPYWSPEVNIIVIDEYSTIPRIYEDSERFQFEIIPKMTINKLVQLIKSLEPYGVLKERDSKRLEGIMDKLVEELKTALPLQNSDQDPMESCFDFQLTSLGYICQKPL